MPEYRMLHDEFHLATLKALSLKELPSLADEIRLFLIESLEKTGGHLSSNLGVVELSIAIHYLFDSPKDKLLFDVGHQSYIHKILTGRIKDFKQLRHYPGISGFTRREESEHDITSTGHASVSLSVAAGLSAAGKIDDHILVMIGDAGLSGGIAFEALNHIGNLSLPIIIILNDNQMSIAKGSGALHNHLGNLGEENFFTSLGIDYWGLYDGHDMDSILSILAKAKSHNKPLVIHFRTLKGKGYAPAEADPISYHGVLAKGSKSSGITYTDVVKESLVKLARSNKKIYAITAAMPTGTGLMPFAKEFPKRFYDVGIAEQHAVTFASGLALAGMKPVILLYSTFLQRAIDQVIHDLVLQKLSAIFLLDRAGVVPSDGESHQGLYDIALLQSLPNMIMMAPSNGYELDRMMQWAVEQEGLIAIRYPKDKASLDNSIESPEISLGRGYYLQEREQNSILLMVAGPLLTEAKAALLELEAMDLFCDLYDARFITPIDEAQLAIFANKYQTIVTIEEAVRHGGWGAQIAALLSQQAYSGHLLNLGVENPLLPQATRTQLLEIVGLDSSSIVKKVTSFIKLGE